MTNKEVLITAIGRSFDAMDKIINWAKVSQKRIVWMRRHLDKRSESFLENLHSGLCRIHDTIYQELHDIRTQTNLTEDMWEMYEALGVKNLYEVQQYKAKSEVMRAAFRLLHERLKAHAKKESDTKEVS